MANKQTQSPKRFWGSLINQHACFLATTVLLGLSLLSLYVGVVEVDWKNVWHDEKARMIFVESRVPRTAAIWLTGISMSVAGLLMQMVVHNRFVEPSTAGTAEGAALGLVAVTLLAPHWSVMAKMGVAAVCAFGSMLLFLALAKRLPVRDSLLVPLVGMIYGGIIGAVAEFWAYEYEILQLLNTWLSGDFSAVLRGRYELLWVGGFAAAFAYYLADRLTIIGMGQQMATSLGLPYRQLVLLSMMSVAMMTALTVITVGMIAFLGLVMPNIVRRFCGDHLRRSLPWSAWLSVSCLLFCDVLSRSLRFPYEIPVSTVFGVLGAGLFLVLLLQKVRHE
ncbi:MAG: iron chelate uptake ABC transporter family permease subunit [Cardiobacteriaceae bacterium]|nr:iron chelate uptake ABC transporter family permease subunit [Cardiobacteriaceae bacterium]